MKNDGEYPLPSKVGGEGGTGEAYVAPKLVGTNGQGPSPVGEIKQPTTPSGVGGSAKEANAIPKNETGGR